MDKIKYENGLLTINGGKYLMVDNSSLISRAIAVDKNIYAVSYFKRLPQELKNVLANTYWVRIDGIENVFEKSSANAVAVGL